MPLLHLQLKPPDNLPGTTFTENPTIVCQMGHEFFTQPVTLRTVSISGAEGATPHASRLYSTDTSHNTVWVDFLTDTLVNSRQVNSNVNDASSIPIPCDWSTMRPSCQQYTSLDYTFNLHHIEPANNMALRVLGSDSNVNNKTRWDSTGTATDCFYQIDLTFEYDDISGVL